MCSSEDQLPKPDCGLRHPFPVIFRSTQNLNPVCGQGQDKAGGTALLQEPPSRAPGAGSPGGARCTHTACVRRPEDVSASDRAYTDFSLHKVKCQEKKASDEEKSMTWSREHREGTEDMRKPRNSSKLNTETLVLSWTVERCALLDP